MKRARPATCVRRSYRSILWSMIGCAAMVAPAARAGDEPTPTGKNLERLVVEYIEGDWEHRRELLERADATYRALTPGVAKRLRTDFLKAARKAGPRIAKSGLNYFYDEDKKLGKYIVEGKPGKALFIGLHGGGEGSGDAGSMAAGMGGGGYWWIFPEVLKKTERGWTDAGTEEFVLELIEAAKRTAKVDPNRVYVTGHSMGGYGTWMFASHHPDVFAGGAAYAGGPTAFYNTPGAAERYENIVDIVEGVIPNLYNSRLLVFQSTDDPRVPPGPNQFATELLSQWRERHPGGFDFRYVQVDDRGHAAPKEGYQPTQDWVAEHARVARPEKLLWQPVLTWKRQFHWVFWREPELNSIVQIEAVQGNQVEITSLQGAESVRGMSILIGEPLFDLDEEVVVRVNGEEVFRGEVEPSFSTLLMTIPRNDDELLFDRRIDLQ